MSSPSILERTTTKHESSFQMNAYVEGHHAILRTKDQEKALPDNGRSVSFVRRGVARDLEPLVSKHFLGINLSGFLINDTNNGITMSARKKIDLISRVIEAKLYRSSLSLEQHADPGTLIERFNALRARSTLMQKWALFDRKRFSAENAGSTRNDYHLLLRNHVGEALYDQIQEASRKLSLLRAECVNLNLKRGMKHALELNAEECCAEDMLPHVLHKLYFNCQLLKSLGALNVHTKTVEMNRVTKPDWRDLLHEAKTLIDEVEHSRCLFKSDPVCCCCSYA
jgi:hypothetical protein